MKNRRRKNQRRSKLGVLGGLIALLGTSFFPASPAQADVLPDKPIINDFSSDPDAHKCTVGAYSGICLFTSRDDRPSNWNYNKNPYPMSVTRVYFLQNGLNPAVRGNWMPMGNTVTVDGASVGGVALRESQIPGVPANARHLWAPGGWWSAAENPFYLLVPNITTANQSTSSRIHIFRSHTSSHPGAYKYISQLNTAVSGAPNGGYASDPSLSPSFTTPYLVYANGTFDNCGKISFAELSSDLRSFRSGYPKHLRVNTTSGPSNSVFMTGVPNSLKGCDNNTDFYFEAPELFSRTVNGKAMYYLMFSAKPAQGNSVIAYATAAQPGGPYQYRGIIMSGSSTEWTNHASIVQDAGRRGMSYFFYHDGGSGTPHTRKVHAECFRFNSDGTIPQITRTTSTSSSSWIGNCWDD